MNREISQLTGVTAKVMKKWEVKRATDTRKGIGGIGWSMGSLRPGATFFGEWIVNGWIKDNDAPRWIKKYDCDEIISEEPPSDTPSDSTLCWLKSDYQLQNVKGFKRQRNNIPAHPQTTKFAHPPKTGGVVEVTDDFIELACALNPGMTYEILRDVMNAYMPLGCKWGQGEDKFAFEIAFASNTVGLLRKFRNGGGMSGIPSGAWMYEVDTLDYDNLPTRVEDVKPEQIIHFTISRVGSPIVNPPHFMGGRDGQPTKIPFASPVPLYFRTEIGIVVKSIQNQYYPEFFPKVVT